MGIALRYRSLSPGFRNTTAVLSHLVCGPSLSRAHLVRLRETARRSKWYGRNYEPSTGRGAGTVHFLPGLLIALVFGTRSADHVQTPGGDRRHFVYELRTSGGS